MDHHLCRRITQTSARQIDAAKSSAKAMVFDYIAAAGDESTNLAVSGIELPSNAAILTLRPSLPAW